MRLTGIKALKMKKLKNNPTVKKNTSYFLGNGILAVSFLFFFFLLWPFIRIFVFPPMINQHLPEKGTFITIPKIHAQAPVILDVDPGNQAVYDEALKHGVAQAKGTALPGETGTVYLFAHSSGWPWDLARYNTIFLRLGELQKGDTIIVRRDGKDFVYKVRESKVVSPSDVSYLKDTKKTQLIVQTCWPIGTSLFRLLVFADVQK
jgi:LPXTG-site transpeptidase (sortase) family protein